MCVIYFDDNPRALRVHFRSEGFLEQTKQCQFNLENKLPLAHLRTFAISWIYIYVGFTLSQATKSLRDSRGIALPLGRPRRRWEDNIKMDLREVGGGGGDWMELAQDRDRWRAHVGTVRNLRVPKMRGISWLAAEPVSFSRGALLHGVSK